MADKSWFSRWRNKAPERKSFSGGLEDYEFSLAGGPVGISFDAKALDPKAAMNIYQTVSPVAQAVDMIIDAIAAADIGVRDGDKTVYEHDALTFLDAPNPDQTLSQFLRAYGVPYIVTGNVFISAGGAKTRPPLEIEAVPPHFGTLGPVVDRKVSTIKLSSEWGRAEFRREQKGLDQARYLHGTQNELYWLKRPSAVKPSGWGYSDLTPVQSEARQYRGVSAQNENLLANGGRPSGALSTQEALGEEQYTRTRESLRQITEGKDSGKILLLDGGIYGFTQFSQTPKDMDFLNQKVDVSSRLFANYGIPLALVDTASMTLNNYQVAIEAFVDNAVMPWAADLLGGLTRFFRIRGMLAEDETLIIDPQSIKALMARRVREALSFNKTGAITRNEMRDRLGYERLEGIGADTIYQQRGLEPVAADGYVVDQPAVPNPSVNASDDRFRDILKHQKHHDGTPFTDAEIERLLK